MNEGLPFIRPLWMLDPLDLDCLRMTDEFSVGDELIVAPILYKGATSREVYLPQGKIVVITCDNIRSKL
jgi:myogenesis-regulating glycosidase